MFDYNAIYEQITDYTGEYTDDFDIYAVMDFIRNIEPDVQSIAEIDIDEILNAFDIETGHGVEGMYSEALYFDHSEGDWALFVDDPDSDDILLGVGEVDRDDAVIAALRFYGKN